MINFSNIFEGFSCIVAYGVLAITLAHILSRVFNKTQPVRLDKNSLVLIAGACMGIGKEMALELARLYHCRILIIDLRSDLFEDVSKQISQQGGSCECKRVDLSNKQYVEEIIKYLIEKNQKIELFIYNAGILCAKRTWDITEREHQMVMRVNYFTPTVMIRRLEHLLSHVCVVGSMTALMIGGTNVSIYTASKHAIVSYLSSLRQEYKKDKKGITVSIGCPYAINTTMFQGFRTRLDFIFRVLDEKYVGKRLVKEFIEKKQMCYIYEYEALLFRLIALLPTSLMDFCAIKFDISILRSAKMLDTHDKQE